MQVQCKVYGLSNASSGIECAIERDLLEVGEYFHHKDQEYIIVSVVENQGRWYANVVPEHQWRFVRRPHAPPRPHNGVEAQETLDVWRERAIQTERQVQALSAERTYVGERLDRLMHMLELLTKDLEKRSS
jgi:hypothetical protein